MENLRKKNETEVKNKIEGHSSKIEKKQKTESQNLKMKWQLKSCEKKMQEHTDSIKRP
jgi:hypothetical protein